MNSEYVGIEREDVSKAEYLVCRMGMCVCVWVCVCVGLFLYENVIWCHGLRIGGFVSRNSVFRIQLKY